MDFDFSDDQKFLKGEARKFLEHACPPALVRAVLDDPSRGHDAGLWKRIAGQGWLGTAIPEEYGGLGLGHLELCAIAEELGRVLAPVPLASTLYFGAEALLLAGSEAQKQRYLPAIAAGELIVAFATAEGPGAPASVDANVREGRLTGTKLPVTDGDCADIALVSARDEAGTVGLYIVDLRNAGVTRTVLSTLDPARGAAELVFDGAGAELLAQGQEVIDRVTERAAVLLAFEQLGGAERCLEQAREYALQRYAFGRPIAGYQAIKHKLADIYVKNELARSNAYYGAWALAEGADELPRAAAAARIAASEAFWFAARESIQTHGGIGTTWEVDCHLYYRRSRQLALVAGAPKLWKERLVRTLAA